MENFNFETTALVQTISPVHIGTGEKLTPLSYIYQGGSVLMIDEVALLEWVSANPRRADQFISLAERGESIAGFLQDQRVQPSELAQYQLPAQVTRAPGEIAPFIKTAAGSPYLPGSSLKGCLRNALLRGAVLADWDLGEKLSEIALGASEKPGGKRKPTGSEAMQASLFVRPGIERKLYSNYDLNRALIISNSRPRSIEVLEVVEVRMLSVNRRNGLDIKSRGNNPITIFVEATRPQTTFRLPLRRDMRLLRGLGSAAVWAWTIRIAAGCWCTWSNTVARRVLS